MSEIKQTVIEKQPDVQVAQFDVSDAPELAHFAVKAYSDIYGYGFTETDIQHAVAHGEWVQKFEQAAVVDGILVAKADSAIVGYIQFGDPDPYEEQPLPPRSQELRKLYVAPEMHGQGVAQQLMDEALTSPVLEAASQVYLWVLGHNVKAQRFYGKYDFNIKARRNYEDNGQPMHDFMMVRERIKA